MSVDILNIIDNRARGLTHVRINNVLYTATCAVSWRKWYIVPNVKVWSKKSYIWKPTEAWKKYCAFKDKVSALKLDAYSPITLIPGDHVVFHMPMPESWSRKKKLAHDGEPHVQRPDLDNLLGGLFDAMFPGQSKNGSGDQHMHSLASVSKVWAYAGAIEIGRPT